MRVYRKILWGILSIVCIIFFSQVIFTQNRNKFPAMRDSATNLVTRRKKSDIYSKLRCCPCDVPFDKCTCPEAKEIKAYLEALIGTGVGKEELLYEVAKKFSPNTILDAQIKADAEKRLIKEAGEKRPQIILEPTSFDFGQVNKKQGKISKIFKLVNRGNSNLIVKNIKTSCPCTLVSLSVGKDKSPYFGTKGAPEDWQAEIKPGQGGELEVVLDLTSSHVKAGKVIRNISIISNDPVYPKVRVEIEAEVKG